MSEMVTLEISEEAAQLARSIAERTGQDYTAVLRDWIDRSALDLPIESLSDDQILALSDLQMGEGEQAELSQLLAVQREGNVRVHEAAQREAADGVEVDLVGRLDGPEPIPGLLILLVRLPEGQHQRVLELELRMQLLGGERIDARQPGRRSHLAAGPVRRQVGLGERDAESDPRFPGGADLHAGDCFAK